MLLDLLPHSHPVLNRLPRFVDRQSLDMRPVPVPTVEDFEKQLRKIRVRKFQRELQCLSSDLDLVPPGNEREALEKAIEDCRDQMHLAMACQEYLDLDLPQEQ